MEDAKYIHGGDIYSYPVVIDFSANINPLPTPQEVTDAVRDSIPLLSHYPDRECTGIRMALAERHHCEPEHVICGNGAADLIFQLVLARRPARALVTAPGFWEYEQALQVIAADVRYHTLYREDGFVLTDRYMDELTEDLDMVFLCSPHNPTGAQISMSLLERIADRCVECGILLVMDECFLDFVPEGNQYSLMEHRLWETWKENVFVLKSLTKMFALAGLRLGYGITGSRKLIAALETCRQPWSVSTPAQMAGIAALRQGAFVRETASFIQCERDFLRRALEELSITVYPSQANFLFFEGEADWGERLLEQGILIRDCSNYRGLRKGDYRVAVRTREENERLVSCLRDMKGKPEKDCL